MTEKEEVLSEGDAFEIALRDHPEWRRKWGKGELPDEIPGEDGQPMNPHLHLTIHTLVERQLAADEPKGILAIAGELEKLGVSRHDIRHAIGTIITNHLWHMQQEKCPFDERRYMADLRKVVDSYR